MQLGDVVYLKSGGRPMTVIQVNRIGDDGVQYLTVAWDGGSSTYPEVALMSDDPTPAIRDAALKVQSAIDAANANAQPARAQPAQP